MNSKDEFRLLVGGYYGVVEMDEYKLKEYVLKDIENLIIKFVSNNPIKDFDYLKESEEIKDKLTIKRKLQDSLIVLNKVNAKLELKLMIKEKLSSLQ